jgi:hypothetical protein
MFAASTSAICCGLLIDKTNGMPNNVRGMSTAAVPPMDRRNSVGGERAHDPDQTFPARGDRREHPGEVRIDSAPPSIRCS